MFTFDSHYRELLLTKDGTPFLIRVLRPEDKQKLVEGFQRLSPESRYRRFFSPKNQLTPGDLLFFTEFDGINHFALGAALLDKSGQEGDGIGVARFIRLAEQSPVAEFAIAVVDSMQRQGIGLQLSERLLAAAQERGVERFVCDILADNEAARELIKNLCPQAKFRRHGSPIIAEFSVSCALERQPAPANTTLPELLRLVGRGALTAAIRPRD